MPGAGPLRALIYSAMVLLGWPVKSNLRFQNCCQRSFVLQNSATGDLKLALETCGSRHCPRCGTVYRRAIAQRVADSIGIVKPRVWRFITLTLGHSTKPLSVQLDHLLASFRRLRQSTLWLSTQLKGYGIIEVTWSASTASWHPHLHILTRGQYLPQRHLSKQWVIASHGSKIVDIRTISSSANAISYVTKYLGKTPNFLDTPKPGSTMLEYLAALRNRKMLINWGTHVVEEYEPPGDVIAPVSEPWVILGSLQTICESAARGDIKAKLILDCLAHGGKAPRSSSFIEDG